MDKKKTKKETPKKSAKPVVKKAASKPAKKLAVKKAKPAPAKAVKKVVEKPGVEKKAPEMAPPVAALPTPTDVVVDVARPKKVVVAKSYSGPTLRLRWIRSAIGFPEKQKRVVQGLGFHRLNEIIVRPDTPMIRGMVKRIPHLVEIVQ